MGTQSIPRSGFTEPTVFVTSSSGITFEDRPGFANFISGDVQKKNSYGQSTVVEIRDSSGCIRMKAVDDKMTYFSSTGQFTGRTSLTNAIMTKLYSLTDSTTNKCPLKIKISRENLALANVFQSENCISDHTEVGQNENAPSLSSPYHFQLLAGKGDKTVLLEVNYSSGNYIYSTGHGWLKTTKIVYNKLVNLISNANFPCSMTIKTNTKTGRIVSVKGCET
jgi:hypothetical protein